MVDRRAIAMRSQQALISPTGEEIEAFSCGVWGESATSTVRPDGIDSPECERQTGQPASTTWQFVRPAQFGFFLPGTDTDVTIVSNGPGATSSVDTDSITVTCQ